jgi:arsenate reductase-like glutaredoxin family protein
MKSLEVQIEEPTVDRLEAAAEKLGITTEELLRVSVEEKLARLDESFHDAVDQVISKNAELYKRLA